VTEHPIIEPPANRPAGHRAVPLLTEPTLDHYPEFRRFLVDSFSLEETRVGPAGLLRVDGRYYELVFLGRSGRPFPSGVEIHALVPDLEPLDEDVADRDLWAIVAWLVSGVGGEWTADALTTTGRIYRVPAATAVPAGPARPARPAREPGPRREALVFDLYGTLVDPLAIATDLERLMPSDPARLVATTWRRTQLEYSFRLTAMNRYEDFARLTARALEFALLQHDQTLAPSEQAALLARYNSLEPFPDAVPALRALGEAGVELALLSNGSPAMLGTCLANSGLATYLPQVISVDAVRVYKPHPAVYRLAAATLDRPIEEIRLVSCNPFDIIGATTAGMRTAWINRSAVRFDTLGDQPDVTIPSLADLPVMLNTARAHNSAPIR
jgi:2-haloacid dehalogenase